MGQGANERAQLMHDLETIGGMVASADTHLRFAKTKLANLMHYTFDHADLEEDLAQARAELTEITRFIAELHPKGER